jgi:hypothetical protein
MNQDKTTKQMIIEGLQNQRDMPVYNADTINKILMYRLKTENTMI